MLVLVTLGRRGEHLGHVPRPSLAPCSRAARPWLLRYNAAGIPVDVGRTLERLRRKKTTDGAGSGLSHRGRPPRPSRQTRLTSDSIVALHKCELSLEGRLGRDVGQRGLSIHLLSWRAAPKLWHGSGQYLLLGPFTWPKNPPGDGVRDAVIHLVLLFNLLENLGLDDKNGGPETLPFLPPMPAAHVIHVVIRCMHYYTSVLRSRYVVM
ncbi:hypothetical protein DFH07DRAFT_389236 [Mycena maculata]|uniref:Uncharacterized protein n=1 Tax=Mycena maculata TaxID=230809 RepID=A0AAD7KAM7_9AGAR|nr:hypothetical protein DFH07DRAFT_389236 [Mycena maculata]